MAVGSIDEERTVASATWSLAEARRNLGSTGWSEERLDKNELRTASSGASPSSGMYAFWRTIHAVGDMFAAAGSPAIFIKCVRTYPYFDSNVDILVPPPLWREIKRSAERGGWRHPQGWNRIEQLLMERKKVKLGAPSGDLAAIHLYGGVSWGYQHDCGLLRTSSGDPDPAQVAPLESSALSLPMAGQALHPFGAAELVMQAAHITSENLRMTMGEALHIQALMSTGVEAEALELARQYGFSAALGAVEQHSARMLDAWGRLDPARTPAPLPSAALARCLGERTRLGIAERRWGGVTAEVVTGLGFQAARRSVRRARRWRRGREDTR
jgi:hypothetical protein